jgi:hypothetical protein
MAITTNEQMIDFPDLVIDSSATATAARHVFRSAAVDTAGLLLGDMHIVNTTAGAGSSTVYLRIYDSLDPVVGTTNPEVIIMCPHGTATTVDIASGIPIATAVSYACVQEAGTAGATSPATTVVVHLVGGR